MSTITPDELDVRIKDRVFVTLKEMRYKWRGLPLRVPAMTETDEASIPWFCRWMFPLISESRAKGAFGHDQLFADRRWSNGSPATRAQADRFMYDVCVSEGMPIYRAAIIRAGLFLGSWWHWYRWRMTWLGPRRSHVR